MPGPTRPSARQQADTARGAMNKVKIGLQSTRGLKGTDQLPKFWGKRQPHSTVQEGHKAEASSETLSQKRKEKGPARWLNRYGACCASARTVVRIPHRTKNRRQRLGSPPKANKPGSLVCTVTNERPCLKQGRRQELTPKIVL